MRSWIVMQITMVTTASRMTRRRRLTTLLTKGNVNMTRRQTVTEVTLENIYSLIYPVLCWTTALRNRIFYFVLGFFVPLYTENIPHCKFTCSACEGWINSFCSVPLFRYMGVSHLDTQRGYMTPPQEKKRVSLSAYLSTGGSSDTIWIWSEVFEVSRVAV